MLLRGFSVAALLGVVVVGGAGACKNTQWRPAGEPTSQTQTTGAAIETNAATGASPWSEPNAEDPMSAIDEAQPQPQKRPSATETANAEARALAKASRPMSDAEVLAVVFTANLGEIETAELAIKRATSPDVKQFAGMMKSQHDASLQKAKSLQRRTKLVTAASDISAYLENETSTMVKDLHGRQGIAFDNAYMDGEVTAHKDVVTALDNRLLPSASNGELKALVTDMRRTEADHLAKAQEVRGKLEPAAAVRGQGAGSVGLGIPEPLDKPAAESRGKNDVAEPPKPTRP